MNMDYQMVTAIAGSIFTAIAASWAGVSLYGWVRRPKFEIRFLDGGISKNIIDGRNRIEVEFVNKKPRPATDIRAYVMFPPGFAFASLGPRISSGRSTAGGRFSDQPFIFNSQPHVLFREEGLSLVVKVDVPPQAKGEKTFELHTFIVCAEGTSKTGKLYLKLAKS